MKTLSKYIYYKCYRMGAMTVTSKKIILIPALLIFFFCSAITPALALDIYWKPANDENATYSQRPYANTNRVDIQVNVKKAKTVEVNNEEAIQIGSTDSELWLFRDYLLKPGENTIKVKVEKRISSKKDKDSDTETDDLTITVMETPASGSFRYFESPGSKLTAFDKSIGLKLPKDTAVIDSQGRAAFDQSVSIQINPPPTNLAPYYLPLSPLYSIHSASSAYYLSNAGELTLKYDTSTGNADTDMITVLYAPPNYQTSLLQLKMMQKINSYNHTADSVTVPFNKFGFGHYLVARVISDFNDFSLNKTGGLDLSWARPYVMALWTKGVMNPLEKYPDGSYVPDNYFGLTDKSGKKELPVTRIEFISMLGRGLRLPFSASVAQTHIFSDMQDLGVSDVQYLEAALKEGWIPNSLTINEKLYFHPNDPLTREDACAFMARAAGFSLVSQDQATQTLKAYYPSDYNSADNWNRPHLLACIQNGLITTTNKGYLEPNKQITRAEAAQMIYSLMQKNGYL